jgi:hypothetical protein
MQEEGARPARLWLYDGRPSMEEMPNLTGKVGQESVLWTHSQLQIF